MQWKRSLPTFQQFPLIPVFHSFHLPIVLFLNFFFFFPHGFIVTHLQFLRDLPCFFLSGGDYLIRYLTIFPHSFVVRRIRVPNLFTMVSSAFISDLIYSLLICYVLEILILFRGASISIASILFLHFVNYIPTLALYERMPSFIVFKICCFIFLSVLHYREYHLDI